MILNDSHYCFVIYIIYIYIHVVGVNGPLIYYATCSTDTV